MNILTNCSEFGNGKAVEVEIKMNFYLTDNNIGTLKRLKTD